MNLFWGKSIDTGNLNHISEVDNGLNCNCICPGCGALLIAKQGEVKIWHFAHESDTGCSFNNESALHLYAKQLFLSLKYVKLPRVRYIDGIEDIDLNYLEYYKNSIVDDDKDITKEFLDETVIEVDDVFLEETFSTNGEKYKADIVLLIKGKKLIVEIFVSHEVDLDKRRKIINSNMSAIEINLSKVELSKDINVIKNILIDNSERKYWIYNGKAHSEIMGKFKKVIYRGKRFPYKMYLCPETNQNHNRRCSDCSYTLYYFGGNGFSYNLCSYPNRRNGM